MPPVRNSYNRMEIVVAMLIVASTAAILAPVVFAQSDRNRLCVENAHDLAVAVRNYVQDYDETIPQAAIWNNAARFQTEISPYAGSIRPFRCPATGLGYVTNAALAGNSVAAFVADNTEMLRDARVHPDDKSTVAFLDAFIERGGVEQYFPDADGECYRRVRQITLAIQQYAQDYDEHLPLQTDDDSFRGVVQPYLGTRRYWNCPDTKQLYSIDQKFRGKTYNDLPDVSAVDTVRDSVVHRSGVTTFSTLDGYAEQSGPRGIKYPVSATESQTRLKALGLALLQYSQDYDEKLPPISTISALKPFLLPYTNGSRVFDPPASGTPFQLNTSVGGTYLYDYPNVASVIWIRDNNNYGDGLITAGFLDGHVERRTP